VAAIALWVVGRGALAHDPVLWMLAPISVSGAWVISFSVMFLIGTLGLYWESSLAVWDLWFGCYVIFSGYLMPLALMPAWLRGLLRFSPFPYVLSLPVQVILGTLGRDEALREVAVEWGYAAVFLGAALLLWRRGLRRFAAYGG
jgi:ABC-2 type transport system permease protein